MTDPNPPDPDELAERLRRLFADDGLTLPVTVAAEREVVSGARRRRRRRLAAAAGGGVVVVAALVFAVVGLAGVTRPGGTIGAAGQPVLSETLTATSEPASGPASAPPTPRHADLGVLGPIGTDGVYLGMPIEQVVRTGAGVVVGHRTATGRCVDYTLLVRPSAWPGGTPPPVAPAATTDPTQPVAQRLAISVLVSPHDGVVQLGGVVALHTPEGIALGSPEQQVFRTYHKVLPGDRNGELATPAPGGKAQASYVFAIGSDGVVDQLWLRRGLRLDCQR